MHTHTHTHTHTVDSQKPTPKNKTWILPSLFPSLSWFLDIAALLDLLLELCVSLCDPKPSPWPVCRVIGVDLSGLFNTRTQYKWWRACVMSDSSVFVCWLPNVPATCECISGTDLFRQFYMLPHWDRSCRPNFPSHPVTVYQSRHWPYNTRCLAR